ncbi:MAG: hypothetical protein RL398_736 [Planctomycetota bacterium]|jgi:3-methyladenine DNA glycosylase AlkC
MAEPFKNRIDAALLQQMAAHLRRADRSFRHAKFLSRATTGLDELELKARVLHVATALTDSLPDDFAAACELLQAALAPAPAPGDDDLSTMVTSPHGLAGWAIWPITEYVAQRGLDHPERALAALHALTQRFTAEFAIRPFLLQHPQLTFEHLHRWLHDPSPHVRRLVSEGSRPRLPWGKQLPDLIADPSPTLPLLRHLQHDPSPYVRRSVANHLNDIAKDHPELVAAWIEAHAAAAAPPLLALLRHAARTLIKKGHKRTLAAFGVAATFAGEATLRISPRRPVLGESCTLHVELHSRATVPQRLVVDYVVHRLLADGSTRQKIWKGWKLTLAPGESRTLQKQHSLKPTTVRRNFAGRHRFELVINGEIAVADAVAFIAS